MLSKQAELSTAKQYHCIFVLYRHYYNLYLVIFAAFLKQLTALKIREKMLLFFLFLFFVVFFFNLNKYVVFTKDMVKKKPKKKIKWHCCSFHSPCHHHKEYHFQHRQRNTFHCQDDNRTVADKYRRMCNCRGIDATGR